MESYCLWRREDKLEILEALAFCSQLQRWSWSLEFRPSLLAQDEDPNQLALKSGSAVRIYNAVNIDQLLALTPDGFELLEIRLLSEGLFHAVSETPSSI